MQKYKNMVWLILSVCSVVSVPAIAVEPELSQQSVVNDLLQRLASPDSTVSDTADDALYDLPPTALPLLEQAATRDLPPEEITKLRDSIQIQQPLQAARMRRWEQSRKDYEFNERTALREYQDVGNHNLKWDQAAEEGLRAAIAPSMYPLHELAAVKLKEAIDSGCDDPLVLYFYSFHQPSADDAAALKKMRRAVLAMRQSHYSAFRKLSADARLISSTRYVLGNVKNDPDVDAATKEGVANLFDACKAPDVPSDWVYNWSDMLNLALMTNGSTRKEAFDQIEPPMEKAMPTSSIPFVIKGKFYVNYAWDARGSGWANSVTDEGFRLMKERLEIADEALNKAWSLNPMDEKSCDTMLSVELGQGQGRMRMEKWFALAIQANPDDYDAYHAKFTYIEPKWYGTEEEALAFARDCGRTRRWSTRLPLLICTAHYEFMSIASDQKAYPNTPGLWQDLYPAYTRYLQQSPNDTYVRNAYAAWAWRCGHYDVLAQQLKVLGPDADVASLGGQAALDQMKKFLATRSSTTSPGN